MLGIENRTEKRNLKLSNSALCYQLVSGCCFCCQNIPSVPVGVANNFEKIDVTKRSKYSSFSFKLRRHTAWRGPEGYNKEPWHKRSSQNDQRQGKKEDSNSSKAKPFTIIELKISLPFYFYIFLFFILGPRVCQFADEIAVTPAQLISLPCLDGGHHTSLDR